jgi:hypothetical protein
MQKAFLSLPYLPTNRALIRHSVYQMNMWCRKTRKFKIHIYLKTRIQFVCYFIHCIIRSHWWFSNKTKTVPGRLTTCYPQILDWTFLLSLYIWRLTFGGICIYKIVLEFISTFSSKPLNSCSKSFLAGKPASHYNGCTNWKIMWSLK